MALAALERLGATVCEMSECQVALGEATELTSTGPVLS